jgi:hypothetical protein
MLEGKLQEGRIMNKASFKVIAVLVGSVLYAISAPIAKTQTPRKITTPSDIKIRRRITSDGNQKGAETVMYVKGSRMRTEMTGNALGITTLIQCDLKRTLMINEKTRTYLIVPTDGTKASTGAAEGDGGGTGPVSTTGQPSKETRGGIVNVTNTISDTGERKDMFGFTARHIKTSMVKQASPDACDKDQKSETDGWYIDFQYAFDCPGQSPKYQDSQVHALPGCHDDVRIKTVGTAKLGFPLLVTTTIYQPDGRSTAATQEVLELSRAPLDASLFDVPEGYALAKDMQELYGMSQTAAPGEGAQKNNDMASSSVGNLSSTANAGMTTSASPKKTGAIRIGVVMPTAQVSTGNAAEAAEVVRNGFANYLKGPTIEVFPLAARLPSQANEEARKNQCDYVLYSSLTQKKGGGGGMFGRAFGNVAGSAAGRIPGSNSAGTAAARSATSAGVYTTAAMLGSIKARDEVSLEYKLESMDVSMAGVTNTVKAKANADGEDIVTPLIEKASQAVVAAVPRKT